MAVDAARAKSLFLAASDLSDPAERAAYLERECGGDAELRGRVEALLRANDAAPLPPAKAGDGTSAHVPDRPAQTQDYGDPTARVGSIVAGKYKLIEEIGEGGMGQVFMAQQTEPVKRAVAVKVIKAGMDSKAVLTRFEAERQALAMMDHPNIAKVLDAGATDGGRPYFVMELVKGLPITKFCDERKLTPRQRLELFVPVCQAIQHAHQKGVIHRDIKPSNVLVAMYDDRPVPKVIDFGVAKAAGQTLTEKTLMTGFGAMVGTPEYMSPEQANMNNMDIDTRSDVYSLGVLLYELLTGSTPVDRKSLGKAALLEILRIVREVEAPKPSVKLSTIDTLPSVAANRGTEPAKLSKLMRGELDWVLMKALEKDRARRYDTANGLARDIQRYLADEMVEARPASTGYRLKKFVRRHPLQLALSGTVALLVLGAIGVAWWQSEQAGARRETDLRRQLEDEQRAAADNARLGRNAEAVAALLGECEKALRAGDAKNATVALDAARKRAAEGGAEADAPRLGLLAADLVLLTELAAIDQLRWTWVGNRFTEAAVVAKRTRDALSRFGADPDASPPAPLPGAEGSGVRDAAARVNASMIKERIVPALDRLLQHEKTASVRTVLQRVDADPYRDAFRNAVLTNDRSKIAELAEDNEAMKQPSGFTVVLGNTEAIPAKRRRELLEAAVIRRSGDVALLMALATISHISATDPNDRAVENLRWYQAALAADPDNVAALNDLGITLSNRGQVDAAIALFKRAIALQPTMANAHNNLATTLAKTGRLDEAVECNRRAVELNPNDARFHENLGMNLAKTGRLDEAIECYKRAIALDARSARAYGGLGTTFQSKGLLDQAIGSFRRAIELDPKSASAYVGLGLLLREMGRVDDAIGSFRKAIDLDPKCFPAHGSLGVILFMVKADYDGAIACFRKAIEIDQTSAENYCNLGGALMKQGRFAESLAATKRGHELGSKRPDWPYPSAAWVRQSEAIAAMEPKLPAFLKGEFQPGDNQQRLGLAGVCKATKLHHTAASLYAAAFANDPRLADDLDAEHRFDAACAAGLAAARQGEDAAKLDDTERARLRKQALDWLRADLALRTKQLQTGKPGDRAMAQQGLRQMQEEPYLAGLRDPGVPGLAKLSSEEQKAFTQLWADVAALLTKTQTLTADAAKSSTSTTPSADRPDQAVSFLKQTLKQQQARLGPDHPDTLASMNNLARAYWEASKPNLALALYEETLKLRMARLGPDHPDTLDTKNELGVSYWKLRQLDKSVPLYEDILKRHEAMFGRNNPNTLMTVANLGVNYRDAGRLEEAIALLEEAHRAAKNHPELRWVTNHLFAAYLREEPAGNVKRWTALIPSLRRDLGEDHFMTVMAMNNLGYGLARCRNFAEAEPMLKDTIEREVRALDKGKALPPQERTNLEMLLLQTRTNLGEMYQLQRKDAQAEELLRKCLAEREKKEPNSFRLASTQSMLGRVLAEQKKFSEAESLLLAGYKGLKDNAGSTPFWGKYYLPDTLDWLTQLYEAWDKPDDAKKWRMERDAIKAAEENVKKMP